MCYAPSLSLLFFYSFTSDNRATFDLYISFLCHCFLLTRSTYFASHSLINREVFFFISGQFIGIMMSTRNLLDLKLEISFHFLLFPKKNVYLFSFLSVVEAWLAIHQMWTFLTFFMAFLGNVFSAILFFMTIDCGGNSSSGLLRVGQSCFCDENRMELKGKCGKVWLKWNFLRILKAFGDLLRQNFDWVEEFLGKFENWKPWRFSKVLKSIKGKQKWFFDQKIQSHGLSFVTTKVIFNFKAIEVIKAFWPDEI